LSVGTQTNGSVIRPASFCGVFGLKPTNGMISRRGLLQTSKSLDQIGCFGRTLEDAALLADVIGGYDASDVNAFARPRPDMALGARTDAPVPPSLIWFDQPYHNRLTADAVEGFLAVTESLGGHVECAQPAPNMAKLIGVQSTIHLFEICQHQAEVFETRIDDISDTLRALIKRGQTITKTEYEDALDVKASAETFFAEFFHDFDAVIAPSAAGEAPKFGNGTGDPIFCTIWTLAGLPCVSMPILVGETGLPIGVQLIGAAEEDDRLMRTANWVLNEISANVATLEDA
ncbi:amidase, partial [Litoreibacter sp.]|nr:amidase [Litoreibacter sp.]